MIREYKKNIYFFPFRTMTLRRRPFAFWRLRHYALLSWCHLIFMAFICFVRVQKLYCNEVRNDLQRIQLPSCGWSVKVLLSRSNAQRVTYPCKLFQPNVHYFGLIEYRLSRTRTCNITVMSGAFEPIKL